MIMLIQAFRLLGIKDEGVYLTTPKSHWRDGIWFWSENVRKLLDMKAIKVIHIRRHFAYNYDEQDYEFVVTGVTEEELRRISRKLA